MSHCQRLLTRVGTIWAGMATVAAAMSVAWLPNSHARAGDAVGRVWLVSTRCAPHGCAADLSTAPLRYWRLDPQRQWLAADERELLESDDAKRPTVIFLHGNRDDFNDAVDDGWRLYRLLEQQADGRPFRFLIWSWPADRIAKRNRPDVQTKAAYSDIESFYLAAELNRLPPQTHLCLVGYSFGARIISGALHLLGGGALLGRNLPEPLATPKRSARAVLAAAALDCDWLLPCHRDGLALSQVEHMLITRNSCDRVLKWYPRMYGRGGPEALGYVGPAHGGDMPKLELVDVTCSVGRAHDWSRYLNAAGLSLKLADYAWPQLPEPEPALAAE